MSDEIYDVQADLRQAKREASAVAARKFWLGGLFGVFLGGIIAVLGTRTWAVVDDGGARAPVASSFHCARQGQKGSEEWRFCFKEAKSCDESVGCFDRPKAACFESSIAIGGGVEWSKKLSHICFVTLPECEKFRAGRGSGLAGEPPVKGPCRELALDEVLPGSE